MRRLIVSLAVLTFFVNPGIACGPDDPEFQYGEADMRATVEGNWRVAWTNPDGSSYELSLAIREGAASLGGGTQVLLPRQPRARLVRTASACGTRTFVRSAGACIDASQMPVEVAYVSGDPAYQTAVMSGTFNVAGLSFVYGQLSLGLGGLTVNATIERNGTVTSAGGYGPDGVVTVALSRTSP
jgi:hypothetical protein